MLRDCGGEAAGEADVAHASRSTERRGCVKTRAAASRASTPRHESTPEQAKPDRHPQDQLEMMKITAPAGIVTTWEPNGTCSAVRSRSARKLISVASTGGDWVPRLRFPMTTWVRSWPPQSKLQDDIRKSEAKGACSRPAVSPTDRASLPRPRPPDRVEGGARRASTSSRSQSGSRQASATTS